MRMPTTINKSVLHTRLSRYAPLPSNKYRAIVSKLAIESNSSQLSEILLVPERELELSLEPIGTAAKSKLLE